MYSVYDLNITNNNNSRTQYFAMKGSTFSLPGSLRSPDTKRILVHFEVKKHNISQYKTQFLFGDKNSNRIKIDITLYT